MICRFLGTGLLSITNHEQWRIRSKAVSPAFHRRYRDMNTASNLSINIFRKFRNIFFKYVYTVCVKYLPYNNFPCSTLKSMTTEFNELGDYWTDQLRVHAGTDDVINMTEVLDTLVLHGKGKVTDELLLAGCYWNCCESLLSDYMLVM